MKDHFHNAVETANDVWEAVNQRADIIADAMQRGYENGEEDGWEGFNETLEELGLR